ncbi:hypothetical protein EV361DRAFT_897817 [Lentinula raphanica]|uniref:Uncharacterized protein n=1 Tax=Lentinula raphanica TaxID=153919 RepID=A0AA38UIA8_9AGAR|nr:hypothetical protein F5878DRAFT_722234 [Lentinula raphanica]KAJ3973821.1 hypothetical protein EV361DRAFT_897817 [Lentinula raphanica]
MFRDLRFIHLMILGLFLMGVVNSAPSPQGPGWFQKLTGGSSQAGKVGSSSRAAAPLSQDASSSSSQPANADSAEFHLWAWTVHLYRETRPDWDTLTDKEVINEITRKLLRTAVSQPGHILVYIWFMRQPNEGVLRTPIPNRSRRQARVTPEQESQLGAVIEKRISLVGTIWGTGDRAQVFLYNRELTGADKYFTYAVYWVYDTPQVHLDRIPVHPGDDPNREVRSIMVFREVDGIKLPS